MDTPPAQRPFPFFDLPQELRDHIYSYLHHDHKDVVGRAGHRNEPKISLRCCPLASASLVCSQFAHEYREVKEKQITMLFYDHSRFYPATFRSPSLTLRKVRRLLQGTLQNVGFAEFNLAGVLFKRSWGRNNGMLELSNYHQAAWIKAATQTLKRLKSFQIRYSLTNWSSSHMLTKWSDKSRLMTTVEQITDLIAIPKLSKLELFAASVIPYCLEFEVVDHDLDENSSIAIWTPDTLWQCKGDESELEVKRSSCGRGDCSICVRKTQGLQ